MEAVGLLAGGIAHDLNNLLTSVLVGVELAESSPLLSAETRSEFGDMKHDCLRAAALIRQLLAIAKRQVINPRPCNSNELVHDLVPMVRGILGEDVLLTESLTATRGVYVDAAQIGQVIFNLAANARAAMPSGGTVTIETRDDLAAGTVIIEVTDSGTGMTPDVQARVFEPFFTTKPTGEGTGLGLSTSYGIVAQSHGQLTFESTPGAGTTFTVTLPAVDAPTTAPAVVPESSESLGDETILVVEDDRVVRDVVVRGLSQHGFTLLEACNGADALAVMEAHAAPIHLVLTDVVMPTMSGAELVAHLRRWYPNIRVLFMSGYSSRAVETFGAIVPNTDLLVKPFDLARLIRTVRSVLDGPSQARSVCESCSAA
jgi:CheY-like chemotaxis protein